MKVGNELKSNNLFSAFVGIFFLFALGSIGIRSRWIFLLIAAVSMLLGIRGKTLRYISLTEFRNNWILFVFPIFIFFLFPNSRHETDVINSMIYIAIVTFAFLLIKTDRREVTLVFKLFAIAGIIVALYISFFRVFTDLYMEWIIPFLPEKIALNVSDNFRFGYGVAIGNSYTFGDYIIMLGAATVLGLDIRTEGKFFRYKVILGVFVVGLIMEGRKGELLCGLMTIVLVYLIYIQPRKLKNTKTLAIVAILMVIASIVGVLVLSKYGYLVRFQIMFEKMLSSQSNSDADFTSGRLELWNSAIKVFMDHPLLGVGWGRFANYTTGVFQETYEGQTIRDVHNVLLQLLCETGMIGTLLIISPIVRCFVVILKHARYIKNISGKNNFGTQCNVFALTVLIFHVTVSMLDPNLYNQYFWCMLSFAFVVEEYALSELYGGSLMASNYNIKRRVQSKLLVENI